MVEMKAEQRAALRDSMKVDVMAATKDLRRAVRLAVLMVVSSAALMGHL
jgi:hypothetical protein